MLGLALLGTAAAAQFGGAGAKGLVYANPVVGARRSAYGHSRVSRASPAAYYRGRQYPVVAAQLSKSEAHVIGPGGSVAGMSCLS